MLFLATLVLGIKFKEFSDDSILDCSRIGCDDGVSVPAGVIVSMDNRFWCFFVFLLFLFFISRCDAFSFLVYLCRYFSRFKCAPFAYTFINASYFCVLQKKSFFAGKQLLHHFAFTDELHDCSGHHHFSCARTRVVV